MKRKVVIVLLSASCLMFSACSKYSEPAVETKVELQEEITVQLVTAGI
ncbi:MAG: hypothetical protein Q4F05_18025 [bacterium]|nr:hypothetical protein [bacterium]